MIFPRIEITEDIPEQYGGQFIPPWTIKIRPKYKDDAGLIAHEIEHFKQFIRTLGLHAILYNFVDKYKLLAEVKAYKVQLKYPCGNALVFADFISTKYNLAITKEEALKLLIG